MSILLKIITNKMNYNFVAYKIRKTKTSEQIDKTNTECWNCLISYIDRSEA